MKRYILDANAFLRFLLSDVREQADEVEKLFLQAKKKKVEIHIPQIVIFEIVFILEKYYGFPKQEIAEKINGIFATPYLFIQDRESFALSLKIFQKNNIGFVDCFLYAKAQNEETELFTFDKKLKTLRT